jgi:hypothetical protein
VARDDPWSEEIVIRLWKKEKAPANGAFSEAGAILITKEGSEPELTS